MIYYGVFWYTHKKIRSFTFHIFAIFKNLLPQEKASNVLYTDHILRINKTFGRITGIHLKLSLFIIKHLWRYTGYFLHFNSLNHEALMITDPPTNSPGIRLCYPWIWSLYQEPVHRNFTQTQVYRPREKYYKNISKLLFHSMFVTTVT